MNIIEMRLRGADYIRSNRHIAPIYRTSRAIHLSSRLGSLEARWIYKLVRPGSVAIDVGANVGQYTAVMNRALKGKGQILAFEPNALAFEQLTRGIRSKNIDCFRVALSDTTGIQTLNVSISEVGEALVQLGSLNYQVGTWGFDHGICQGV